METIDLNLFNYDILHCVMLKQKFCLNSKYSVCINSFKCTGNSYFTTKIFI